MDDLKLGYSKEYSYIIVQPAQLERKHAGKKRRTHGS